MTPAEKLVRAWQDAIRERARLEVAARVAKTRFEDAERIVSLLQQKLFTLRIPDTTERKAENP